MKTAIYGNQTTRFRRSPKLNSVIKSWGTPLYVALLFLYTPTYSYSQLRLDVLDELNFGTITNENGECKIKGSGALVNSSGQTCLGTGVPAKFKIYGDPYAVVIASVFQGSAINGISFIPKISGSAVKTLNAKGKKSLKVVGSLFLNNASAGDRNLSYTVSINYE